MQQAILFVENTSIRRDHLIEVAKRARARGLSNLLIHGKQLSPPEGLFDEAIEHSAWTKDDLLKQSHSFQSRYAIQGLINLTRLFTEDGLIGAVVAEVAEEMGLPYESAPALFCANNKFAMRAALKAHGLATVDFELISHEDGINFAGKRLGYPVILKPLTGAASHLILKSRNADEAIKHFRLALEKLPRAYFKTFYQYPHSLICGGKRVSFLPLRQMLMEQYIEGRELSVECLALPERIIPLLVHEKLLVVEAATTSYEHLLITPPTSFSVHDLDQIKQHAVDAIRAIGLRNSFVHVEMRFDPHKGPKTLEVNPRVGGGMISQSLATSLGIDVFIAELDLAIGSFRPQAYSLQSDGHHAMFFLFPPAAGIFKAIHGIDEVKSMPNVLDVQQAYPVGSKIYGDDEECFLIQGWMKGNGADDILKTFHSIQKNIHIDVGANEMLP